MNVTISVIARVRQSHPWSLIGSGPCPKFSYFLMRLALPAHQKRSWYPRQIPKSGLIPCAATVASAVPTSFLNRESGIKIGMQGFFNCFSVSISKWKPLLDYQLIYNSQPSLHFDSIFLDHESLDRPIGNPIWPPLLGHSPSLWKNQWSLGGRFALRADIYVGVGFYFPLAYPNPFSMNDHPLSSQSFWIQIPPSVWNLKKAAFSIEWCHYKSDLIIWAAIIDAFASGFSDTLFNGNYISRIINFHFVHKSVTWSMTKSRDSLLKPGSSGDFTDFASGRGTLMTILDVCLKDRSMIRWIFLGHD